MVRRADVLDGAGIVVHTEEVLRLKIELGSARAKEVSLSIEIGEHLRAVQASLAWGDWERWLGTRVHITRMTAAGLMKLAETRGAMPKKWADLIAPLGQTKAIRACYASDGFRPKLSATWSWKGVKATAMTADEFDAAVDAADPGHRGKKTKGGSKGSAGAKPGAFVPLEPPTLADVTARLVELRRTERDPKKWKPLIDWFFDEFGPTEGAKETEAEPAAPPAAPAVTGGAMPGLIIPGYGAGAAGAPASFLNPDGKARLQSIIAIVRQLEKEMKALVTAKSKVGPELKVEALDATSDLVDVTKKLAAWVSGTPRR